MKIVQTWNRDIFTGTLMLIYFSQKEPGATMMAKKTFIVNNINVKLLLLEEVELSESHKSATWFWQLTDLQPILYIKRFMYLLFTA